MGFTLLGMTLQLSPDWRTETIASLKSALKSFPLAIVWAHIYFLKTSKKPTKKQCYHVLSNGFSHCYIPPIFNESSKGLLTVVFQRTLLIIFFQITMKKICCVAVHLRLHFSLATHFFSPEVNILVFSFSLHHRSLFVNHCTPTDSCNDYLFICSSRFLVIFQVPIIYLFCSAVGPVLTLYLWSCSS